MRFTYRGRAFSVEGVSSDDHIYKIISESKCFYEIDLLSHIQSQVHQADSKERITVAVDVGANIGNHSIFFANFVVRKVLAIEPNPSVLPVLEKNISQNPGSVTVVPYGVGDKPSLASISIPEGYASNVGAARLNHEPESGNIQVRTLDSVFDGWSSTLETPPCVSLMKVDVEGMEPHVLRGAANLIRRHKPQIFCEAADKKQLRAIEDVLGPLGYKRLAGHWAATPVYHFYYKPSLSLQIRFAYQETTRVIRRLLRRSTRMLYPNSR